MSFSLQQSGAEEACWAHNPEVGGSKPPSATNKFSWIWKSELTYTPAVMRYCTISGTINTSI